MNIRSNIVQAQLNGTENICYDEWGEPYPSSLENCDEEPCAQKCYRCQEQYPCDQSCSNPNCGVCSCNKCGAWYNCSSLSHSCSSQEEDDSNPGGGGSTGGRPGGSGITIIITIICNQKYADNNRDIINMMNSINSDYESVRWNMELLRELAAKETKEYGMVINKDKDYLYYALHQSMDDKGRKDYIATGTEDNVILTISPSTYAVAHVHPKSAAPSIPDVAFLFDAYTNKNAKNITGSYVLLKDGSEYAIYVEDRAKFEAFCNNSSMVSQITAVKDKDKQTKGLKTGSDMEKDFNDALLSIYNDTKDNRVALSYAISYILTKYNTGVGLMERKNVTSAFKKQDTGKNGSKYELKRCK